MASCTHLQTDENTAPLTKGCQECLKLGDDWVHLRRCLHCGHVGCCDSSKNKHATKHFRTTHHPVVQSFEPGEMWTWCYVDEVFGEAETELSYES
jgi:uncharacterized UBP type Zn finger protein